MISRELERVTERLDEVLEELHAHPDPRIRAAVAEFSDGIQRIHAEALRRMVELLAEDPDRFRRALDDPVISNLVLLYDLAIVDERERVREVVDSLSSALEERQWSLELVGIDEGVVHLRLGGSGRRDPAGAEELRRRLEVGLRRRVPGYRRLELDGPEGTGGNGRPARSGDPGWEERFRQGETVSVVPSAMLEDLERRARTGPSSPGAGDPAGAEAGDAREVRAAAVAEVDEEGLLGVLVDGYPVLLVREEGSRELRAFRNACPGSILPLHLGSREGDEIRCPWHGCRFHLGSGRRLEGEGPDLDHLDLRIEEGEAWVRLR